MINIVLLNPEIPPNTGNIARLCAANQIPLHLVGTPGFRTDDKAVRRAGLDYWPFVDLRRARNLDELRTNLAASRFFYLSARAERIYTDMVYRPGDCFVFGPESRGLPEEVLRANWAYALRIPMRTSNVRSLNLATAVAIVLYEALRQLTTARD